MNCPDCLELAGVREKMLDRDGHYYCRRCGRVILKDGAFQGFGKPLKEV